MPFRKSSLIDNSDLHNLYNKAKIILQGIKTLEDAYNFINKLKVTKYERDMLFSLAHSKTYNLILDNNTLNKIITDLNGCKYREDVYDNISQLMKRTEDIAQIRTFARIANSKPLKPMYISLKDIKNKPLLHMVYKKCPHCSHKCIASKETEYIVCGYSDSGYDWDGCGKDWCFRCAKILCKSWEADQLYLQMNRSHDNKCCKKHSGINGKKYPEDYCQCQNNFIKREKIIITN
jgi:hypothetical protein